MKESIKLVFKQTVIISFLELVVLSLSVLAAQLGGESPLIPWYFPLSMLAIAFLTSLPTLLLKGRQFNRKFSWALLLLHCLCLYVVVAGGGYCFGWYSTGAGLLGVSLTFLVIYGLVWFLTGLMQKHDAKVINQALEGFRDEE